MRNRPAPTVVWNPNVEIFQLLANLTEEGSRAQSRAVPPVRRACWLKFDAWRRSPAVTETGSLMRAGFWLDSLCELALVAEPLPRAGFAYPLSLSAIERAGAEDTDGMTRLSAYLESAAAFTADAQPQDFLRSHTDSYLTAVSELEGALGDLSWLAVLEKYFGVLHRSYMCAASLLLPAGFSYGVPVAAPEGPMAFFITAPFIEPDGSLTFASEAQAFPAAEREFVRSFIKPVIARGMLPARTFVSAFNRNRDAFRVIGQVDPFGCLEDHLVQVVQARLMHRRGEIDAALSMMKYDEDAGFRYTRPMALMLEEYEKNRGDFPTFESFFPRLMESFN
jgi:hypothetical protein